MIPLEFLPYGQFATRQYLFKQGLERYQLDNALRQEKVYALSSGVYARPGVPIEWQGLASSLYRTIASPVYVGACLLLCNMA